MMCVRQLVEELRRTPNPDTGKPSHSLSEIARIAGASAGWPAMVLAKPPATRGQDKTRISEFASPLRRYLRKLLEEKGDAVRLMIEPVPGIDIPRRRPKPEPEPAKPKVNPQLEKFMLAFDGLRIRLLDDAIAIEELAQSAPGCFRPAILEGREALFKLCDSLSTPTPTTETSTNASH